MSALKDPEAMPTCLVIDDSESMREVASGILTELGVSVAEADDAPSGLEACAAGVDAVLLDWDLPKLGALDFLRGAASLSPRPVVILCATENDARQFGLARAAGAGFHLLKPYGAEDVAEVLIRAGIETGRAVA